RVRFHDSEWLIFSAREAGNDGFNQVRDLCAIAPCPPDSDVILCFRADWEGSMGRRWIGQEVMGFARPERRSGLDDLAASIDWAPLEARLAVISPPGRGEQGWPPLALLKALLIGFWYDLSDVKLAEALDDRA